jgi:hypothetical protein
MLRSQRRRRRIKRPNIINSLKRKAGQVIDPSKFLPQPVPLHPDRGTSKHNNPSMRLPLARPLQLASKTIDITNPSKFLPQPFPLHPERGTSKQYNPSTKFHLASPLQLASETIDITNRANSNSSQGSMSDFRKTIKRAFPDKTRKERRYFEKQVTSKTITPRRRLTSSERERRKSIALLIQKATEAKNMLPSFTVPQKQLDTKAERRARRMRRRMLDAEGKKSRKRRK